MGRLAPLMSSASGSWQTTAEVLDLVRQVDVIALDPCTTCDNPTRAHVICIPPGQASRGTGGVPSYVDGLAQDWADLLRAGQACCDGLAYVNPPYGREIGGWVLRCHALGLAGGEVIALLPARTDTAWWHGHCAPPEAQAVCFWRGRLTFVGAPAPAPFPSALVYWGPRPDRFVDVFAPRGAIWR